VDYGLNHLENFPAYASDQSLIFYVALLFLVAAAILAVAAVAAVAVGLVLVAASS